MVNSIREKYEGGKRMNEYQQKFYEFIMGSVEETHTEDAEKLLQESFERQNNGTFNMEFLEGFEKTMAEYLKPERKEQVLQVMSQFKQQFQR